MSPNEAFEALGLNKNSSLADVKATYRRRAHETHPDSNPGDPDATEKFRRTQEAYERLKQHFAGASSSGDEDGNSGGYNSDDAEPGPIDPVALARGYMAQSGTVVLADQFFENTHHIKRPSTPNEFHQFLLQPEVSFQSLLDDMMLDSDIRATGVKRTDLSVAVRKIVSVDAKARTSTIFKPLLRTLGPRGRELKFEALSELVAQIFNGPTHLITAGLLHFVWQVHRKMLGYEVNHHLVPVVWSEAQGTGKTTFVQHFCAPLKELLSPPVAMEDFIDTRFSSALDYAVIFLDEIPPLTPLQVDALKLTVSSEEVLRRQLGTSKKQRVRQRSTAMGTANGPVERYFPDPSGHRRFFSIEQIDLRHRPEEWSAVKNFDFERVWRTQKATDMTPILPYLDELRAYQAKNAPKSPLLIWLSGLDLDSEEMLKIRKSDGFRADDLRLYFNVDMNLDWSRQRFSNEMERHFADPLMPFRGKRTVKGITYYRVKS